MLDVRRTDVLDTPFLKNTLQSIENNFISNLKNFDNKRSLTR